MDNPYTQQLLQVNPVQPLQIPLNAQVPLSAGTAAGLAPDTGSPLDAVNKFIVARQQAEAEQKQAELKNQLANRQLALQQRELDIQDATRKKKLQEEVNTRDANLRWLKNATPENKKDLQRLMPGIFNQDGSIATDRLTNAQIQEARSTLLDLRKSRVSQQEANAARLQLRRSLNALDKADTQKKVAASLAPLKNTIGYKAMNADQYDWATMDSGVREQLLTQIIGLNTALKKNKVFVQMPDGLYYRAGATKGLKKLPKGAAAVPLEEVRARVTDTGIEKPSTLPGAEVDPATLLANIQTPEGAGIFSEALTNALEKQNIPADKVDPDLVRNHFITALQEAQASGNPVNPENLMHTVVGNIYKIKENPYFPQYPGSVEQVKVESGQIKMPDGKIISASSPTALQEMRNYLRQKKPNNWKELYTQALRDPVYRNQLAQEISSAEVDPGLFQNTLQNMVRSIQSLTEHIPDIGGTEYK